METFYHKLLKVSRHQSRLLALQSFGALASKQPAFHSICPLGPAARETL
jgi:hypothetical protein